MQTSECILETAWQDSQWICGHHEFLGAGLCKRVDYAGLRRNYCRVYPIRIGLILWPGVGLAVMKT